MISWIAIGVTVWPDILGWMGLGGLLQGLHTACVGIGIYVVMQAAALSKEHTFSLANADELNRELGARIKMLERSHHEIQLLNEELRRQIADRSRELSLALERLESSPRSGEALAPGELVAHRYRIVRKLGTGGMGTVYEVKRLADGRSLALKILNSKQRGMAATRFAREGEIIAQVDHENVVSVVDVDLT